MTTCSKKHYFTIQILVVMQPFWEKEKPKLIFLSANSMLYVYALKIHTELGVIIGMKVYFVHFLPNLQAARQWYGGHFGKKAGHN